MEPSWQPCIRGTEQDWVKRLTVIFSLPRLGQYNPGSPISAVKGQLINKQIHKCLSKFINYLNEVRKVLTLMILNENKKYFQVSAMVNLASNYLNAGK